MLSHLHKKERHQGLELNTHASVQQQNASATVPPTNIFIKGYDAVTQKPRKVARAQASEVVVSTSLREPLTLLLSATRATTAFSAPLL